MKIGDRIYVHGYVDEIRKDCVIVRNNGGYFGTVKSEIVEAQKPEDIVNVCRCKDCKHMGDVYLVSLPWLEQKEHRCKYWEHPTTPDDYCSRAERKEE